MILRVAIKTANELNKKLVCCVVLYVISWFVAYMRAGEYLVVGLAGLSILTKPNLRFIEDYTTSTFWECIGVTDYRGFLLDEEELEVTPEVSAAIIAAFPKRQEPSADERAAYKRRLEHEFDGPTFLPSEVPTKEELNLCQNLVDCIMDAVLNHINYTRKPLALGMKRIREAVLNPAMPLAYEAYYQADYQRVSPKLNDWPTEHVFNIAIARLNQVDSTFRARAFPEYSAPTSSHDFIATRSACLLAYMARYALLNYPVHRKLWRNTQLGKARSWQLKPLMLERHPLVCFYVAISFAVRSVLW